MTFDEYDKLVESFEDCDTFTYYPSEEEWRTIESLAKSNNKIMEFLIFLSEKGKKPENKEEEANKKYLDSYLRKNLILEE